MPGPQQVEEITVLDDVDYGNLGLRSNPFAFVEIIQGGRDDVDAYLAGLCAAELESLWQDVVVGPLEQTVLWFAPGPAEHMRAEILMIAALMRRLTIDPEARLLPTYLNVELAYMDFARGVSNALGDRLIPREFRRCLYQLVRAAFDRVLAGEADGSELDGLPVADYARMLAEGRELEFSKALFPQPPPREDPQEMDRKLSALDPEQAAEELVRRQEQADRWNAQKDVRRHLRNFIGRLIDESKLGPAVTAAAHEGLARGFAATEPFLVASDYAGPFQESIAGMIRFVGSAYKRCAFIVDKTESVVEFTDQEQQSFVSGLEELSAAAGRQALWLVRGPRRVYEMLGLEGKGFLAYRESAAAVEERIGQAGRPEPDDIGALARRFIALQHEDAEKVLPSAVITAAIEKSADTLGALRALGVAVRNAAAHGRSSVASEDLG
jgi:hypothetical protein